jgi:hypothetical protein
MGGGGDMKRKLRMREHNVKRKRKKEKTIKGNWKMKRANYI